MTTPEPRPEWYYVGHYGQLGPLTREQMTELAQDGVIDQETFVWKPGMADWRPALEIPDFAARFQTELTPPPPPTYRPSPTSTGPTPSSSATNAPYANTFNPTPPQNTAAGFYSPYGHSPSFADPFFSPYSSVPKSDKNRLTAGLLNIIPGFGRFYLGYAAHGVLQFLTSFCGVGLIWSWVDGLIILSGSVRYDGYGRELQD